MDGLIFGFIDNLFVIIGAHYGYELDKIFNFKCNAFDKKRNALLGAGLGNTVSDFLGAVFDPTMHGMVLGIFIGCLIPLVIVPFMKTKP